MKSCSQIAFLAGLALIVLGFALPAHSQDITPVPHETLTHQQQVWVSALEWCESNGIPTALNPKDRDGTPSYGAFQFKPSTFALYAKSYGMASTTDYKDYDAQKSIVERMVGDPAVRWEQQFPDCVRKLGRPPKVLP